jgi:RimJ/RimL family protein N-acetyltransferase
VLTQLLNKNRGRMRARLRARDRAQLRALFAEWRSRLTTVAVIEGLCPGEIYVDDAQDPRTGLLWDHVEGELYLAGAAHNEAFNRAANDLIRNEIRSQAETHLPHLSEFTLFAHPDRWGDRLEVVLRDTNPMLHQRRHFMLKEPRVDWRAQLPEGFVMTPLDAALFDREDLAGMDTMHEWVLGDWRTAGQFEREERGFCLIHGKELASWCASEYTCRLEPDSVRACEVGIYTREGYRRQGFATLAASATVECCLAEGIERIGWHCWASNRGSAATARKVGFELADEQPVWNACFNAFDNWLLQAHYYNQAGRVEEAVERWEQAFEMWEEQHPEAVASPHLRENPDTVRWCYCAAGRAWAQLGDPDAAFRNLNRAVDEGWRDVDRLRGDEGLTGLHGTPEWSALLQRLVG